MDTEPTDEVLALDLDTCGLPLSCEPWFDHIGRQPFEAVRCEAELVLSGEVGVVQGSANYGGPATTKITMVFLGDGTLVRQSKVTDDYEGSVSIGEHERCDVVIPPELADACATEDGDCSWDDVANCEVVDAWTCEELLTVLQG